jgi:hypothetical protein
MLPHLDRRAAITFTNMLTISKAETLLLRQAMTSPNFGQ